MAHKNNLIHVFGEVNVSAGESDKIFSLQSDIFYTDATHTVKAIRIPAGVRIPIKNVRLSGNPGTVQVWYTNDMTVAKPVWRKVGQFTLNDSKSFELGNTKTIELRGITGNEGIQFRWDQAPPAEMTFEFDYEYVCE